MFQNTSAMKDMRDNGTLVQRCYFLTFITEDIDQVRHIYIMAASLDAILILPTIVLNILLIISLYRSPQLNKPCTKLLYSLAISDVLVGMVIEPVYLTKKIAELHHWFGIYCYTGMITYIAGIGLTGISFFTLTVIAVDRYFVVHSGTKYKTIVTNTRVTWIIIAIWALSVLSLTQLFLPRESYPKVAVATMMIGLIISTICYIRIFYTLRKNKKISNTLVSKSTSRAECRYKRSISTMLYIFVIFMVCYLPFLCTSVAAGILGESSATWGAEAISSIIIYANSLINPIILFCRIREIKKSASSTISSTFRSGRLSLQIRKIYGVAPKVDQNAS